MISKVDSEKIDEMIQDYIDGNPRKYRQAYYVASNSQVIAVDDSDGECFTEVFDSAKSAIRWLERND